MYKIKVFKNFEKDVKKNPLPLMTQEWIEVMSCLIKGEKLPEKYKDHALHGDLKGYRDCHVFNDLVLLYRYSGEMLELHYLGSHNQAFAKAKKR